MEINAFHIHICMNEKVLFLNILSVLRPISEIKKSSKLPQ